MDGRYLGPVGKDHYGRPVPKSVHGSCDLGRFTSSATAIRQAVVDVFERIADSRLYVRRLTVVAGRVRMLGRLKPSSSRVCSRIWRARKHSSRLRQIARN